MPGAIVLGLVADAVQVRGREDAGRLDASSARAVTPETRDGAADPPATACRGSRRRPRARAARRKRRRAASARSRDPAGGRACDRAAPGATREEHGHDDPGRDPGAAARPSAKEATSARRARAPQQRQKAQAEKTRSAAAGRRSWRGGRGHSEGWRPRARAAIPATGAGHGPRQATSRPARPGEQRRGTRARQSRQPAQLRSCTNCQHHPGRLATRAGRSRGSPSRPGRRATARAAMGGFRRSRREPAGGIRRDVEHLVVRHPSETTPRPAAARARRAGRSPALLRRRGGLSWSGTSAATAQYSRRPGHGILLPTRWVAWQRSRARGRQGHA